MKTKIINAVLWFALILAMAASVHHLAWTFGTVEQPGLEWMGWIPALAVDMGLAALAYSIQIRKKAKRPTAIMWGGVVGFATVSALANFYHALAVEGFALSAEWIAITKAVVLSATLPVAYIFLGEIVSSDDAITAEREAKRAEREAKKAEREAEPSQLQAEPVLLVAEPEPTKAEPKPFYLCECGYQAETQAALNGHKRKHAVKIPALNGKAH